MALIPWISTDVRRSIFRWKTTVELVGTSHNVHYGWAEGGLLFVQLPIQRPQFPSDNHSGFRCFVYHDFRHKPIGEFGGAYRNVETQNAAERAKHIHPQLGGERHYLICLVDSPNAGHTYPKRVVFWGGNVSIGGGMSSNGDVYCDLQPMCNCHRSLLPAGPFARFSLFFINFIRIGRPLIRRCHAIYGTWVLWLSSALITAPYVWMLQITTLEQHGICGEFCTEIWPDEKSRRIYTIFVLLVQSFIPFSIMAVCYNSVIEPAFLWEKFLGVQFPQTSGPLSSDLDWPAVEHDLSIDGNCRRSNAQLFRKGSYFRLKANSI